MDQKNMKNAVAINPGQLHNLNVFSLIEENGNENEIHDLCKD
jgi:hypothetical protein